MGRFTDVPTGSVWVHAVSVGEVQSASALVRTMKRDAPSPGSPPLSCLLSTVTRTGREMAVQLISGAADRMVYSPWDVPRFVRSALDAAS